MSNPIIISVSLVVSGFFGALFTWLGIIVRQRHKTKRQISDNDHKTFKMLIEGKILDPETIKLMAKRILFLEQKTKKIKETEDFFTVSKQIFDVLEIKKVVNELNERLNQINKTEQLNDWNKNNENLGYRNGDLGYEQENDKEKN